jgi:uncharacterized repeat protein (TIGR01451 family)
MRTLRLCSLLTALTLLLGAPLARAEGGSIELKATAEKEVRSSDANGVEKLERVEATVVTPGEQVIYSIQATNVGEKATEQIVITDPIPGDMTYVEGSADADATAVTFSIDGGESYEPAADLFVVDADGNPRPAEPADYTHVRWELEGALEPGESRSVEFRARLN